MRGSHPIVRINVQDEYSELKSVVIGYADKGFRFPQAKEDISFEYMLETSDTNGICEYFNSNNRGHLPAELVAKENENLNSVADTLHSLGVQVYRPRRRDNCDSGPNYDASISSSQYWQTKTYMQAHCPRDLLLIIDNKIIICPTVFRGRRQEVEVYYADIFSNIRANCRDAEFIDLRKYSSLRNEIFESHTYSNRIESEPIFDAASILKIKSKKILYQISSCSNKKGLLLLQSILPDFEVLPLEGWYNGLHIDSTISILNQESMLFNPKRCTYNQCKSTFSRYGFKKFIACPDDIYDHGHRYISTSSKWIAMNLLMINPYLALVDSKQEKLRRLLKSECNINSVPVDLPYGRDFGGGAHCISLDLERAID